MPPAWEDLDKREILDVVLQLDDKVEAVEAGLAVVPGGVAGGARGGEADADAEAGAEGEDGGRGEEQPELGAVAALAELLGPQPGPRGGDGQDGDGDGQEGQDGEEGADEALDVQVDAAGGRVEGEEGVHRGGDGHDQHGEDAEVQEEEDQPRGARPADARVVGPDDALGEDEVDEEEEQDAGLDEDGRRDGEVDVGRVRGPGDAQGQGGDARRAEAEEEAREDELVVPPAVDLEDGHVGDGGGDVEEHQTGADGVVQGHGGMATQAGGRGGVGRP
ncbi:hypothetical protein VSDG_00040 [Cytospora chrysosperma]|uniref:Uncharacterized protein n=1 Tax=Cytospora chrysosperma TaxID=252740 RepID=A0A423WP24_CYTCH|nr:hypothetical protein VSDG_00040 [Valsa sordida]